MQAEHSLVMLLNPDLNDAVKAHATTRRYARGQSVHAEGDTKSSLSIIVRGRLRFGRYSKGGDYIQTAVLGPGHCFGEAGVFLDMPRPYSAEALDDTELLVLGRHSLETLLTAQPDFALPLLKTLTSRLYESLAFADELRSNTLIVRIAKQLLRLHSSGGYSGGKVRVRQSDLAYGLGQSRVSVGKALAELQALALIKLGYRSIRILDVEALKKWAAERDFAR